MNTKMWNFYKDSEKGQNTIKIFEPIVGDEHYNAIAKVSEYAQQLGSIYSVDDAIDLYFQITK